MLTHQNMYVEGFVITGQPISNNHNSLPCTYRICKWGQFYIKAFYVRVEFGDIPSQKASFIISLLCINAIVL